MNLRWLHLSDFHTGKDGYGQRRLFREILTHVAEHAPADFVFITGDIAQAGLATQYDAFAEEFLLPLEEIVGINCPILMVPGNHDVDRNQEKFVTREVIRQKSPQFFDPKTHGLAERQAILSRFAAYREQARTWDASDWLAGETGCFIHQTEQVGILGLNTAWFAEDDGDERQLTPGKGIVETGLEKLAGIKIILGHHPLDWFAPDDEKMLRALFGKHQVIYLHGHLHQNHSRFEEGAGQPFLTLQSGAAFQAREDDQWVNGLLWGELTEQGIALEPWLWNKNHQEWALDGMAFPETYRQADRWILPLPGTAKPTAGQSKKAAAKPLKTFKAPPGWEIIDRDYLEKVDKNPDEAVILSYFDGRIPNWGLALCPQIPRRTVVSQLTERLVNAPGDGRPSINLLLGAGGEGKSTAFLQTIEAVLQADASWRALHRRGDNAALSRKLVEELPHDGGQHWLITSDDADLIAADVYALAFELQSKGRGDVHFLLCARFTDWRNTKISPPQWERLPGYYEQELRGLDNEDAERIVAAWSAYQDKGLGRLAGLSQEDAVAKLVAESRSEKSREDGAFLGALLRLRLGDELKGHVKKLLDRLNERKILPENPNTLLDAFAYIAAMHAENQLFLSKLVLAKTLGIELRELRSKVLWRLGMEAAADVAGEMVFTPHRAVAEAAMDILKNTLYYDIDVDELYVDLVVTAEALYQSGHFIANLAGWRYLSDHFFEQNNTELAIRLAQALLKEARTNSLFRVKLAQLFHNAGEPKQALQVFREAPQPDNHRFFFHKWAILEGHEGNHAVSAWLDAVALADDTAQKPPDNRTAAMCLKSFGMACRKLFEGYNKPIFMEGCGSAGQLGLGLGGLETKVKNHFLIYQQIALSHGVSEVQPKTALKSLHEAAIAAWQQREIDLPPWISSAEDLTFNYLIELKKLKSETQRKQRELEEKRRLADLGQMATMIAHNINNPVGIIRASATGALTDLQEGLFRPEEELKPLLQKILSQTQRLHEIVTNFQKFSHGDRYQRETVNLNELVKKVCGYFDGQFQQHRIKLLLNISKTSFIVESNAFLLEEILMNLLSNAKDAVLSFEQREIYVTIQREKENFALYVENKGKSIPVEQRKKLFAPFYSNKPHGTGLGLYTAFRAAEELGGHLAYQDRAAGGACFKVILPGGE